MSGPLGEGWRPGTPPQETAPSVVVTYLTQRQLCDRWHLSGRTLERWRADGSGPPWAMFGGSIRYRLSDIEAFEARNSHGERG